MHKTKRGKSKVGENPHQPQVTKEQVREALAHYLDVSGDFVENDAAISTKLLSTLFGAPFRM